MAAKKRSKTCAYCGQLTNSWTDDHVVPDCMWGDRDLPNRLVTVRTCAVCNGFWSLHEGYFRSVVAMASDGEKPMVKDIIVGDVTGHLKKDAKFRREITGSTTCLPSFNELGLFTGMQFSFKIDWTRWDTIIGKIVRGMVYFDIKRPLLSDYAVQSWRGNNFWGDESARQIIDQMSPTWANMGADDKVFLGKRSYSTIDPFRRVFLLTFYESVMIFAWTCPRSDAQFVDPSHPDQVALAIADRQRQKREWHARQKAEARRGTSDA